MRNEELKIKNEIPRSEMFRKLHFRNTPFERGNAADSSFKGGAEEQPVPFFREGGGLNSSFLIFNS